VARQSFSVENIPTGPKDILIKGDILILQPNFYGTRANIVRSQYILVAHILIARFYCSYKGLNTNTAPNRLTRVIQYRLLTGHFNLYRLVYIDKHRILFVRQI
jgi:hypothetical protein